MAMLMALIREESGQGMTEYALILAFVALAVVLVLGQMAEPIVDMFHRTIAAFDPEPG
ncbi:Flp family type IVb pilin [Dethiobacter alkaliphilus]|uniref:Flp/Fap pilin component n=1 Tax=Dethiobacter alkaliphilus AHT 1 TaxID=555088 RepID=C0GKL4_DETAL|nr:Flp family type IVb pilin [Dethiobacter alkaliphilus]EEG76106.1 Flp/Fap pilin component [Dethiobacter alkaliphilus AHT 1]